MFKTATLSGRKRSTLKVAFDSEGPGGRLCRLLTPSEVRLVSSEWLTVARRKPTRT